MGRPIVFQISEVECYCGGKGDQTPKLFLYENGQVKISEILDRWYEGGINPNKPVYNYFKIKSNSGDLYLLRFNTNRQVWSVKKLNDV